MKLMDRIHQRIGDSADRPEAGESSASQQNSDNTITLEESITQLRRRVEDIEFIGVGVKPISPLPLDTTTRELVQKINYIIQVINKLATNSSKGYL